MTSISVGDLGGMPILLPADGSGSGSDEEATGTGDSPGETTSDGEPMPDCKPWERVSAEGECETSIDVGEPPQTVDGRTIRQRDPDADVMGAEAGGMLAALTSGEVPALALVAVAIGVVLWIASS